jgi:delta 1-pyrroline-5-carboxylate dehydrogenase
VDGLLKSIKFSAKFTILNLCGDKLVSVMDIIKVSKKILNINNNVLIKETNSLIVCNSTERKCDVGPVINERQFDKITSYIERAKKDKNCKRQNK